MALKTANLMCVVNLRQGPSGMLELLCLAIAGKERLARARPLKRNTPRV